VTYLTTALLRKTAEGEDPAQAVLKRFNLNRQRAAEGRQRAIEAKRVSTQAMLEKAKQMGYLSGGMLIKPIKPEHAKLISAAGEQAGRKYFTGILTKGGMPMAQSMQSFSRFVSDPVGAKSEYARWELPQEMHNPTARLASAIYLGTPFNPKDPNDSQLNRMAAKKPNPLAFSKARARFGDEYRKKYLSSLSSMPDTYRTERNKMIWDKVKGFMGTHGKWIGAAALGTGAVLGLANLMDDDDKKEVSTVPARDPNAWAYNRNFYKKPPKPAFSNKFMSFMRGE